MTEQKTRMVQIINQKAEFRAAAHLPVSRGSISDNIAKTIYVSGYMTGRKDLLDEICKWIDLPPDLGYYKGIDDEEGLISALRECFSLENNQ